MDLEVSRLGSKERRMKKKRTKKKVSQSRREAALRKIEPPICIGVRLISFVMEEHKKSAAEVATLMGVEISYVEAVLAAKQRINFWDLKTLSKSLKVPASVLLFRAQPEPIDPKEIRAREIARRILHARYPKLV